MAEITVQQISTDGLEAAAGTAATAAGDTFKNNGRTFIIVEDTGTTAPTVTINSLVNCSQGHDHNLSVAVQSGEMRYIGPFPKDRFNDSDGMVTVTYDDDTDVTISVFSL